MTLGQLASYIGNELDGALKPVIANAIIENQWFTEIGIRKALLTISKNYLSPDILKDWTGKYPIKERDPKSIGLVLAGNIPMVGIHDLISVFVSGNISLLKYSSKDKILIPALIDVLIDIDSRAATYFREVERLKEMDAVIATGGETAATHFQYYFGKYPNIIRKNRSSVGVITDQDGPAELRALGGDVFDYFGLGCRNVSKIYVPEGFELSKFFESIVDFNYVIDHHKYKNNYDYSYSIYLLGKQQFLTNNVLIIMEEERLSSRIACLHYEQYNSIEKVSNQLRSMADSLQCVSSSMPIAGFKHIPFGTCQSPAIDDYADGVDTLDFLTQLK